MALNLSHQLGVLAGKPIKSGEMTDSSLSISPPSARMMIPKAMNLNYKSHGTDPSPPMSPVFGANRADLSVACKAFAVESGVETMEEQRTYREGGIGGKKEGVPVFVMMPLDSVTMTNTVNRRKAMKASLQALKSAGVEGIMIDVWWGLVEKESPGTYNWGGYNELLEIAKKLGLKVQAVMSFHQCGGNVGDSVTIPLPQWVIEEVDKDPELAYTDQWGRRNHEYISLGADTLPVLKGRTPVQCYSDFMRAFRDNFKHLLGETIVEIQVGMGPAGELRYPSYPEQEGTWKFPGIGAFQCYDKYSLSSLQAAAEAYGKPEWGSTGPTDAGHYNNWPEDTQFFKKEGGGWNTEYGEFFLSWYSQMLLDHGERILSSAKSIFEDTGVKISVKIAGIHWHYGTRSHAPELTAGYYNTRFRDGYLPIAQMLARHNAIFNFTCIEMRDHEQPQDALCAPEKLVNQVGMGPAGELRYPSYPEQEGTWKFPGIGAFQCYDKYSLSSLQAAAEAYGKPEWGSTGPTDAGHYNNWPEDTQFFKKEGGGWNTEYGEFFLSWYSQMLLDHGERILSSAKSIFEDTGVKISVKIAGIHWHYGTRSHAPELTAGYYNTRFRDGYLPIAQMLARHNAIFNFTCIEMRDHEQPQDALCAPEKLVNQVALATLAAEVPLAGENALPRYDDYAHEQILKASALNFDQKNEGEIREMCAFTYLRMNPELFQADNWGKFVAFVKKMGEGRDSHRCWEEVEREAEQFVHVTQPLVQEAAVALTH